MPTHRNASENIELCTEMPVPEDKFIEAAIKAIEENSGNAPIRQLRPAPGINPYEPMSMALLTEYRWRPGRRLRVRFLDGESVVRDKVVSYARQWEDHANITLDFGQHEDAEIRISFSPGGSWSYLGTVALVIEKEEQTMNFGWLTPDSQDDEYSRVVLHEFGHALSAIHEHQHPQAGIPWDREKVYRYYEATQGWSREDTDVQVLNRYAADITNFSSYDPTSIMQYSVPNELTIGDFEVGWNRVLSNTDKTFIGTMYPKVKKGPRELALGQELEASIGAPGEEDHYQLRIDSDVVLKRSEERRVGKECRSRWSPYH